MHPINDYIQIALLQEPPEEVLTEKPPLQPALVLAISPDFEVPFKPGAEIMMIRGKAIPLNGCLFIFKEHIFLHK